MVGGRWSIVTSGSWSKPGDTGSRAACGCPDGYRSRLTDYLSASEHAFLALTDVEVSYLHGGAPVERHDYLALSVSHIVLARPAGGAEPEPADQ